MPRTRWSLLLAALATTACSSSSSSSSPSIDDLPLGQVAFAPPDRSTWDGHSPLRVAITGRTGAAATIARNVTLRTLADGSPLAFTTSIESSNDGDEIVVTPSGAIPATWIALGVSSLPDRIAPAGAVTVLHDGSLVARLAAFPAVVLNEIEACPKEGAVRVVFRFSDEIVFDPKLPPIAVSTDDGVTCPLAPASSGPAATSSIDVLYADCAGGTLAAIDVDFSVLVSQSMVPPFLLGRSPDASPAPLAGSQRFAFDSPGVEGDTCRAWSGAPR